MAKRQNIVNSGVYKCGRVQRGKLLLHVWVSFSLLYRLENDVHCQHSLHSGFMSKSSRGCSGCSHYNAEFPDYWVLMMCHLLTRCYWKNMSYVKYMQIGNFNSKYSPTWGIYFLPNCSPTSLTTRLFRKHVPTCNTSIIQRVLYWNIDLLTGAKVRST